MRRTTSRSSLDADQTTNSLRWANPLAVWSNGRKAGWRQTPYHDPDSPSKSHQERYFRFWLAHLRVSKVRTTIARNKGRWIAKFTQFRHRDPQGNIQEKQTTEGTHAQIGASDSICIAAAGQCGDCRRDAEDRLYRSAVRRRRQRRRGRPQNIPVPG